MNGIIEQEIASAMKFIIESAGNPAPYYYSVPEDFMVPAVYFPPPELTTDGDTLLTYAVTYRWYVKFFHKDTQSAYELGFAALNAIQYRKNLIPLIDETGALTGRGFRMKDPALRSLDVGMVQLTLTWDSPRPYYAPDAEKMMTFFVDLRTKNNMEVN